MKRLMLLAAACVLSAALSARATTPVESHQIELVGTGDVKSRYPDGIEDPPVSDCPTGWTCANKGDGDGAIDELSTTSFRLNVEGTNEFSNFRYAHKSCSTSDCQIEARIPAQWLGHLETFTSFGVGMTEGTAGTEFWIQAFRFFNGETRCKAGTGTQGNLYNVLGTVGSDLPLSVAVTHDKSANEYRCLESLDGVNWSTFGTYSRAMPNNSLAYVYGTSHQVGARTEATLTNIDMQLSIDLYTPSDPPGGSAPVLVTPIPNQSSTQGVAYSMTCSDNWTGETSYSMPAVGAVGGLPTGTGLSFNTANCTLSGTPTASDVSASPRTLTISGVNVDGSTPSSFQMVTSQASGGGATINIAATTATYNCATSGVGAGDTLVLLGTDRTSIDPSLTNARGPLSLVNCKGNGTSKVRVRNRTSDTEPLVIYTNQTTNGGFLFKTDGASDLEIDGTGKWSGASSAGCGWNSVTKVIETNCGIKLTRVNTGRPTAMWKCGTTCTKVTFKGVEIDSVSATGGSGGGIGISINDHGNTNPALCKDTPTAAGCAWRENIEIANNYIHDQGGPVGGECMYIGPNGHDPPEYPIRNIRVHHNVCENISRDGINLKMMLDGDNRADHNYVKFTGLSGENAQNGGIAFGNSMRFQIDSNVVLDTGGPTIKIVYGSGETPNGQQGYARFFNNILVRSGRTSGSDLKQCIRIGGVSNAVKLNPILAEHNTCVTIPSAMIQIASAHTGTKNCRFNIGAAVTGAVLDGACTQTINQTGTIGSFQFVNSGADNYHLQSGSPAVNAASGSTLNIDIDDQARPNGPTSDVGADEYVP